MIDRDVGLSVKLLRYINSAYIGMRGSIGSIRQAVMMLGSRGVSRWALLVALTGGPNTPRELSVMGLTRARMCELLGADLGDVAGDQLFTVGLLSVADALLEVPLETIVEELPLADEVSAALLRRDGPAGAILKAVVSYEQGDFDVATLRSHAPGIASSYRDALGWAVETVLGAGRLNAITYRSASVKRVRIDTLLSARGMFPSRSAAAASVLAGDVLLLPDRRRVEKPGQMVSDEVEIEVLQGPPFVSRGGVKLRNALDALRSRRLGAPGSGRRGLDRRVHRLPAPGRRFPRGRGRRRVRRAGLAAALRSAGDGDRAVQRAVAARARHCRTRRI